METRRRAAQPAQPPKEAAYAQSSNPVSQTPQEQRVPVQQVRHYGDAPAAITRTAESKPSSDEARAQIAEEHEEERQRMQNAPDTDLEYGVEQQPSEGYIADSVAKKGMGVQRAQAGAHAGPVGSAAGPGHPGFRGEEDLAAHMNRKRENHDRILDQRAGQTQASADCGVAEREAVRQQKLRQNEEIDVQEVVREATGDPVVGR
ncbi:hypothetical protein N7481_000172 [Penicillium waksmanii]|uniref:uncharacterized protein n=1 Tax=Penicillium waksmanii TaxID=69791 RepID=UPI002549ACE9|nr:uncharacterized protein N7481_000172 [Penicillium waksmanii]KAJ5999763.1 hypothetical protein N7481_000172 [Penicillium waksmanii]